MTHSRRLKPAGPTSREFAVRGSRVPRADFAAPTGWPWGESRVATGEKRSGHPPIRTTSPAGRGEAGDRPATPRQTPRCVYNVPATALTGPVVRTTLTPTLVYTIWGAWPRWPGMERTASSETLAQAGGGRRRSHPRDRRLRGLQRHRHGRFVERCSRADHRRRHGLADDRLRAGHADRRAQQGVRSRPPGRQGQVRNPAVDGIQQKLTTALAGGTPPDVIEIGNTQTAAFASNEGVLTD